ncbi:ATP-binding protein [Cellulosimicrobium cellulans]|uniref:ATP-binding protein n=1 Tax=Cellulosimicrobium cellulans TaxID=1710 RepID=UPI0009F26B69|nr:ATP-binding protein [Cellulosimicrobium cellulans]
MPTDPGDAPLVVLSATATPPWLEALPGAFATLWERAPWVPAEDRFAVELATTEIAANIVRHSPVPESVEVRAELDADAARVRVTLRDSAPAADVDLDQPMPGAEAESGRGVALARESVDLLEHRADPDGRGNLWVLERRTGVDRGGVASGA